MALQTRFRGHRQHALFLHLRLCGPTKCLYDADAHIPAGSDDASVDVDGGGSAARTKSAAPDRRKPKTRGASSKKGGQGGRAKGGKATAKGRSATEEEDFDSDEAEARCEEKVKDRESLQNLTFDKMKRREL
eukprot:50130-Eustigmatos_ZCMA.PRE.1